MKRNMRKRERPEADLKTDNEKYRLLFEAAPVGIGIADLEGKVLDANPSIQEMMGFTLEELRSVGVGATYAEPEERMALLKALREKGIVRDWEVKLKRRDGTIYTALMNVDLVELYGRKLLLTTARDITDRKQAEEMLRLLSSAVEEAPDGVQIVDLDGYIIYSNRAVERMYGFSGEEFRRKHVNEMNVDPNFAADIIIPCIKKYGSWAGELMVKHRNGREFSVWLNTSLVKNSKGEPIAMVGIIRDMTERRSFEEALRESEERYRNLFEDSPISLWEEDSSDIKNYLDDLRSKGVEDFRVYFETHHEEVIRCTAMVKVVNVNKATVLLFRALGKKELMDGLGQIFTEHSFGLFKEELIAIAQGRTEFEGEDVLRTMAGNEIHVFLKWSVAPGHEVDYSKRHVSMIDITERKRVEEAIKKYAGELEESNSMKELFIDIMHHDLMNHLATASGFIELLKEDETQPQKKSYIETVERSLARATELIDSATKFSRIERLESLEFVDMDLKGKIEEVIENLRPLASKAGVYIENNVTRSMPIRANNIIGEVFASLIMSVIKYARGSKRIIVNSEEGDVFWKIRIIDREGLKDTDKTMIFNMLCGMEKDVVKGLGLDLAIARRIVRLHRGGIGVEDIRDGGSVFIVELPKIEYLDQPLFPL
ncbi:MAG TPA: PAS domain S-box protein [candidate division Zixibacteria bacterium]|nr:PAS domain S-box protein [candidate division Zixibacteria bacterium]